jgi:hypothetical protein
MRTTRTLATASTVLALLAGTALAVGAQSSAAGDPAAPVGFTGRISFGPTTTSGTEASVDGHTETRGTVFAPTVAHMSDERLVGTVTLTLDLDDYPAAGTGEEAGSFGGDPSLRARTWRIENDAGAWEGPDFILSLPNGSTSTTSGVLTGEGAYEGLLVAWQISSADEGWDVVGYIVPGDAPPGE